ncbi:hypothetical protein HDU98_010286 [Podochytrium sp. JEL0797]|nr:hypothetical protein HDU98_010286 [Podochytrium sp. JEL0797]
MTLQSSSSSVTAGGYVTLSWTGANPASKDDWVLFTSSPSKAPSTSNYMADCWQYTYGRQAKLGYAPPISGFVSVKAPATPGTWTAYYCEANGYTCLASVTITTTAPQVQCLPSGTTNSKIQHVIVVISENHSFDSYFGNYCQAPTRSQPSCNTGPSCCEQGDRSVNGVKPVTLTDAQNLSYDNDHVAAHEICEMNGGKMDKFIGSGGCSGSSDKNFAMASGAVGSASQYWGWASQYAMADRYFQSAAGQSSENDMYFARASWVFQDNDKVPLSDRCYTPFTSSPASYQDPTIADLLVGCNVPWSIYAQGFTFSPPVLGCYPSHYDPSDNPFEYYPSLRSSAHAPDYFKNFDDSFSKDVQNGHLPAVTYIKALGTASEHPGISTISAGENFNAAIISQIQNSALYRNNTLIILTPDESGGLRDSVAPPSVSAVDNQVYGPRVPFIAVGSAAKKNYVSHVQMEPASLIRFIESNFLGGKPGQLQTRDAVVNNIGDLLDESVTGYVFP